MELLAAKRSFQGLSRTFLRTITSYSSIRYASAQNVAEIDNSSIEERSDKSVEGGRRFSFDLLGKPSASKLRRERRKLTASRFEEKGGLQLPSLDEEKDEERKFSLKIRQSLRKQLANAKEAGGPLDKAFEGYTGMFRMNGFERAMVAIEPEFALPLFKWGKDQEGFWYKPRVIYTMMNALRKGDMLEEARKLVQSLEDSAGAQLCYSALFIIYMNDEKQEKADEIMGEMRERGMELHYSAYSRLLNIRFKRDGIEGLMELYKEHRDKNWMSDAAGYNPLLARLCNAKRTLEAYDIYLDTVSKGVEHLEGTHQVLINALLGIDKVDDAFKLALTMIKQGVKSRATPFKRLVNHLAYAERYEDAVLVFKELLKLAPPNGVQLLTVLIEKGQLDLALEAVKELKSHGVKMKADLKPLLLKLCDGKRVEDAREVFDVMVAGGVHPDAETCSAVALCGK